MKWMKRAAGLLAGLWTSIAIDGLPMFPGTEGVPAAQRPMLAERVRVPVMELSPYLASDCAAMGIGESAKAGYYRP